MSSKSNDQGCTYEYICLHSLQDAISDIYTFLETMYISNRIKLSLKGILSIGY